jgi:hypothetical protein
MPARAKGAGRPGAVRGGLDRRSAVAHRDHLFVHQDDLGAIKTILAPVRTIALLNGTILLPTGARRLPVGVIVSRGARIFLTVRAVAASTVRGASGAAGLHL